MKKTKLLAAICLISITAATASVAIASASGETVELGLARVSMDLEDLGAYAIRMGEITTTEHKDPDFVYEIIPANIEFEETSDLVGIEVHQMSTSEPLDDSISNRHQETGLEHCIEKSNLVPVRADIQTDSYEIDGQEGLIATIDEETENPLYIVAYSPDQEGGSGSIVCIVASELPWEATRELFDSIETEAGLAA